MKRTETLIQILITEKKIVKPETLTKKEYIHPYVHSSVFTIAKV